MADCAVGLLVDVSVPEPPKIPRRNKTRNKNRKAACNSPCEEKGVNCKATKENDNPVQGVVESRRNSITLSEAPEVGERILVDVTEKSVRCNQGQEVTVKSPWTLLSESDSISLLEERFDFDMAASPALSTTTKQGPEGEEGDEDEVFFGPVSFTEKCMVAVLKTEEVKPLSPLSSSQMAEIVKEAHSVAHRITSTMKSTSSTDSDSFSSPIARWKASKRTPKKETLTSKTPKRQTPQSKDTPKRKTSNCKTPNPDSNNNNNSDANQTDSQRRSGRLRSETFTKSEEISNLVPDSVKQTLFNDIQVPGVDSVEPDSDPVCWEQRSNGNVLGTGTAVMEQGKCEEVKQEDKNVKNSNTEQPTKVVMDSKSEKKGKQARGLPKPTGLKRPGTRMPISSSRSMLKSSSSESLASSQGETRTRQDSVGSEGVPDTCDLSIMSDLSDISNASTTSNVSTTSRSSVSKLAAPKGGRLSTGLPVLGSKLEKPSGLAGLKRPVIGENGPTMNRSLDGSLKKSAKLLFGEATKPSGLLPHLGGLNRSLQMPSSKLNKSGSVLKPSPRSGPVRAPRQSTPIGPGHGRFGAGGGSKLAKPGSVQAPETKQQLVKPGDIHRKTLAMNRSKVGSHRGTTGPLKATGPVMTASKTNAMPRPQLAVRKPNGPVSSAVTKMANCLIGSPGVKKSIGSVATPVKPNKNVQPKKLTLSTSFDSPERPRSGHVAASTPRSTSKSMNRRSFLPTPTKHDSRLVSRDSDPARGVSCASVGSFGSSIHGEADSVFEGSPGNMTGPGGDNCNDMSS